MNRRTALRAGFGTAAAVALGGALARDGFGQAAGLSGVLRLATGEPSAFYEAFGHLLADELASANPGLRCRVRTTAGSVDNIELLRAHQADLALTLTATARDAADTDVFPRPVPLRAIGRVYETYLQFAVRADAGVRTVADLRGHVVSLGPPGSGAAVFGQRLLRAAGLSSRSDVRVRHLPLNEGASAMAAGTVDGLLVAGGVPLPALKELDERPGLHFLPLAELLPRLGGRESRAGAGLEQVSLPQGAYRMAGGVATIGVSNLLVCRPTLRHDVAEAVTRLLVMRATSLVPGNAVGAQFLDVRSLIGTGGVALHPGALAAYRALHG
ncbi:TAXI family TRAP transporter solute-binding subunit [Streptomyces mayonensis]|uniref:TAXI family TRAP transporter solute-binding subunit n=1 Tax=Streptomyces mayonensis TaxID=2750816 RepID=UPI001C1E72D3|nr:TAXI family TRAP transporter solute-binding subunit [Streptomyces sp. A108]MBU6529649.1 TAXI family TRAP transporter solute-binding subunit [Streptomyces sp. A108]